MKLTEKYELLFVIKQLQCFCFKLLYRSPSLASNSQIKYKKNFAAPYWSIMRSNRLGFYLLLVKSSLSLQCRVKVKKSKNYKEVIKIVHYFWVINKQKYSF